MATKIEQKELSCEDCPLNGEIRVPFVGPRPSDIMFVGESPGAEEIKAKPPKPFIGRAGKLARRNALAHDIDWDLYRVANSARCKIDKNELTPSQQKTILAACRRRLVKDIARTKPKIIVCLGDFALRQVTKAGGITKKRGKLLWSKEFSCWVLPVFHPAYILRNMSLEAVFADDLKFLSEFRDAGFDTKRMKRSKKQYRARKSIRRLLAKADQSEVPIWASLDTETQGAEWLKPRTFVISYSVSWEDHKAVQIFLHERSNKRLPDMFTITPDNRWVGVTRSKGFYRKLDELRALVEHPNIRLTMQNGVFDMHQIRKLFVDAGLEPPTFSSYALDLQTAAHCLDENRYRMISLEELQWSILGESSGWKQDFYKKHDKFSMIEVPKGDITKYASEDADVTRRAGMILRDRLDEDKRLAKYYRRLVHPASSKVLFVLEENGVAFDLESLPEVRKKMAQEAKAAAKRTLDLIPKAVVEAHEKKGLKLTRWDFVRDTLYSKDGFKLKPPDTGKKGKKRDKPSADHDARQILMETARDDKVRQFLKEFETWSEWNGILTKGIKQLVKYVAFDGRIHSHFTTTIPVTGRVSSSGPNLMNIPKRGDLAELVNRLIVARPGYVLIEADLNQAELRWIAHVSGDREMRRVYRAGEDIHGNTARALSGSRWAHMSEKERKDSRTAAKPGNFGLLYLMSPQGFVNYCYFKAKPSLKLTLRESEEYCSAWYATYSGIPAYHDEYIAWCKEFGWVESPFGRKRRLPEIWSNDYGVWSRAARQAVNFPIQSAASDNVLFAAVSMLNSGDMDLNECRPVLFIHDSLVFEVRENQVDDYARFIKNHLEHAPIRKYFGIKFSIPMVADLKVGPNRAEMQDWKEAA